jgi:hypothetical protein
MWRNVKSMKKCEEMWKVWRSMSICEYRCIYSAIRLSNYEVWIHVSSVKKCEYMWIVWRSVNICEEVWIYVKKCDYMRIYMKKCEANVSICEETMNICEQMWIYVSIWECVIWENSYLSKCESVSEYIWLLQLNWFEYMWLCIHMKACNFHIM